MEECFPLLCPLMLCLKPEGLFSRVSSPALRSGWGLCVKIDLHSRRKKKISVWKCGFAPFSCFNIFFWGECCISHFCLGKLKQTSIEKGFLDWCWVHQTPHEFQHGHPVLCSLYHGSTGLMHQLKENHEFKAGMRGNKVQNIKSRRKHKKSNRLVSKIFFVGES